MQRGRSPVSVADLVTAQALRPDQVLHFRNGPRTGHVTATGTIAFKGSDYSSPSTAARAATGGSSTNGWLAWTVDDGGSRITLAEVRNRFLRH
jgi:hypothetical protein